MYPKAEILFPFPVTPRLRNLRGEKWAELVDRISQLPETDPDALAAVLMKARPGITLEETEPSGSN